MQGYFDAWRPTAASENFVRDFPSRSLYSPQSAPILLPGADNQLILPLFSCASSAGNTSESPGGISRNHVLDSVQQVGGAVWALHWCPSDVRRLNGDVQMSAQYLAVGCHPLHSVHNLLGNAVEGAALIQIWEAVRPDQHAQHAERGSDHSAQHAAHPSGEASQPAAAPTPYKLPELVMGIAHDGGLAWNCQWCPDAQLADDLAASAAGLEKQPMPRLGLLAAALGDGTLRIWAVPQPQAVQELHRSCSSTAAAPSSAAAAEGAPQEVEAPIVDLAPVAVISSRDLGGSMPSVIDWLPAKPHDLLLVGCWDGSVAIIKLNPNGASPSPCSGTAGASLSQQQQQQQQQQRHPHAATGQRQDTAGAGAGRCWELLSFFPAEPVAVRAVRWIPSAVCGETPDHLHRHVFLTGGHAGRLHIWDDRDQFQPLYQQILSITTVLNAVWTSDPFGVVVAMEDASLRGVPLDSSVTCRQGEKTVLSQSWRGPGMGALWALDVHPAMQLVAYGGEDGEVGVFAAEYETRRRTPHTPIAGLSKEADLLVVKSAQQMGNQHGIFGGKIVERQPALKSARFPDEVEAIHRVAWWPGGSTGAWLASGGAAGLVRLQWIQRK